MHNRNVNVQSDVKKDNCVISNMNKATELSVLNFVERSFIVKNYNKNLY